MNTTHAGMQTAGNNRKIHTIRETHDTFNITLCGVKTPRRAQTTQERIPYCKNCEAKR